MTPFETAPERAYRDDNTFRSIVDTLEALLHEAQLTPSEVRAASMLACIHYEMRRPFVFRVVRNPDGTYDLKDKP